MALSTTRLTTAIINALDANGAFSAIDGAAAKAAAKADSRATIEIIVGAIIDEIVANASVVVAAGIPVSTAGTAAAQTGSTTSPGTGEIS